MGLKSGEIKTSSTEINQRRGGSYTQAREQAITLSERALYEMSSTFQSGLYGRNCQLEKDDLLRLTSYLEPVVIEERKAWNGKSDKMPGTTLDEFSINKAHVDTGSLFAKTRDFAYFDACYIDQTMFSPQSLIIEQAIVRQMGYDLRYRTSECSVLPLSMTPPDERPYKVAGEGRFYALTEEMRLYGVETIGSYYDTVRLVRQASSGPQIDSAVYEFDRKLKKMGVESKKRELLSRRMHAYANEQGDIIQRTAKTERESAALKEMKASDTIKQEFDEVWDDFTFFTPEEEKTFLHDVPKAVLDMGINVRKLVDVASFHRQGAAINQVVREGMHFRTGRAETLAKFHKKESSLAADKEYKNQAERFTKKYIERVRDGFLVTEAAGFEFEEKVKPAENMDSNTLVLQSMKTLINEHRPITDKTIHFTILSGENYIRKLNIEYHHGMTEQEMEASIQTALLASSEVVATSYSGKPLTHKERTELGYVGYTPQRTKDKNYRHVYGTGEKEKPWGDYLIQIKKSKDAAEFSEDALHEHLPESLFAVDSHSAAVLIDERHKLIDGTLKTVVRYNHTKFDGIQARNHAKHILDNMSMPVVKQEQAPQDKRATTPQLIAAEHVTSLIPQDGEVFPVLEGMSSYIEEGVKYPKLTHTRQGENGPVTTTLSPAFTRSFILALSNDVTTYHHLHAGDKSKWEFYEQYGDRFDDVQPITTLLAHVDRQMKAWKKNPDGINPTLVKEWISRYGKAKRRAEKSHSDSMLSAAIVGRYEKAVVGIGSTINRGISAYSSPGSMLSPLPWYAPPGQPEYHRELHFRTAQAMSYANQKIDLFHPEKSMGVIGYNQEGSTAVYTCRKLPCQAQVEFHDAIVGQLLPAEASGEQTKKTLTQFNRVIKSWDELIKGKTSLDSFLKTRKSVFNKLIEDDNCGEDTLAAHGIVDEISLQVYLNKVLQDAANETLNREKIMKTKADFEAFMSAVGVIVS